MDAITLETIHECLDAGGKLICTDADMGVHTYKNKDIASLSRNEFTKRNQLVVNGEIQDLKYLVYPNDSLVKVKEIIDEPKNVTKVYLFIHTGVKLSKTNSVIQDDVETASTSLILLLRLMFSSIANKNLYLFIQRYRSGDEIDIKGDTDKVFVVGVDYEPFKKNEMNEDDCYFIHPDKVNNKILIKNIKRVMKLSNKVCASRIESIYNEYLTGKFIDRNFEIWASMYSSIYKLHDPRRIMVPELIGSDDNTKTILRYLHRRYLISKQNDLGKPLTSELKVAFDEFKMVGSYAYKCERCAKDIKERFINSMITSVSMTISTGVHKVKSVFDLIGILDEDDVRKALKKYAFIVSANRSLEDDDITVLTIYVDTPGMIALISNNPVMETLKGVSTTRETIVEFKQIRS